VSRKKKGDEGSVEIPVVPAEPVERIVDEIPEQPVVKPTKKKQQQRQQPLPPLLITANTNSLQVEAPPPVSAPVEE